MKVKGGATQQERGLAARLREKYMTGDIDIPLELRAPEDRQRKFRPVKHYLNSVVHDDDDQPVDKLVLKDQNDNPYMIQYSPYDFQTLSNYLLYHPQVQRMINPKWRGY